MRLVTLDSVAFFKRFVLPALWIAGLCSLVTWAGCHAETDGSSQSSSSAASSSSGGHHCKFNPDCPSAGGFPPQPGDECPEAGLCCDFITTDHSGGNDEANLLCSDAGTWEPF